MMWVKASCLIVSGLSLACPGLVGCESRDRPPEVSENVAFALKDDSAPPNRPPSPAEDRGPTVYTPEAHLPTIVAFGDSLTAGFGVSREEAYPAQLEERLRAKGFAYRVLNAGVSGETTAGALRRVDWILKHDPSIVILELGANDGLRGLPLRDTYANLEAIIRRLQDHGVTVLLVGMKIPPNYGLDYTTDFSMMYERLAEQFHVPFMPFFLEDVAARPEFNQGDGIHPTAEGYRLIVENVLEALIPVLRAEEKVAARSAFPR